MKFFQKIKEYGEAVKAGLMLGVLFGTVVLGVAYVVFRVKGIPSADMPFSPFLFACAIAAYSYLISDAPVDQVNERIVYHASRFIGYIVVALLGLSLGLFYGAVILLYGGADCAGGCARVLAEKFARSHEVR